MDTVKYADDWVPPWRQAERARCEGPACTNDGQLPGPVCIAATLVDGLCAACRRTVDDDHTKLRLGV